jgi:ABC-type Zn uptake system ZnuABC Zn-binding protein ZnuA
VENRRLSVRKIIVNAIAAAAVIAGSLLNAVPSNAQGKMKIVANLSIESGARIAGVLYSDAPSEVGAPASTYLDLMRNKLIELAKALGTSS